MTIFRSLKDVRDGRPVPRDEVDEVARRLLPALRSMVRGEVEKMSPAPAPRAKMLVADAEIMRACRKVAEACDRLEQAKYTAGEIPARRALERAAKTLQGVMMRHGRLG